MMRKPVAALLALGLIIATPAQAAPDSRPAVDAQRLALAHQVFEAMGGIAAAQERMKAMMDTVTAQMAKSKPAGASAEDTADLMAFVQAELSRILAETIPATERIYAEQFTADQLRDILAFYASPTGQALKEKLPAIGVQITLAMQPAMDRMKVRLFAHIMERVCAKGLCTPEQKSALAQAKALAT